MREITHHLHIFTQLLTLVASTREY